MIRRLYPLTHSFAVAEAVYANKGLARKSLNENLLPILQTLLPGNELKRVMAAIGTDNAMVFRSVLLGFSAKVRYVEDGTDQEIVLPGPLILQRKQGDCKSFALFCYAVATWLGFKCKLLFASYHDDGVPTHVYNEIIDGSTAFPIDLTTNSFVPTTPKKIYRW